MYKAPVGGEPSDAPEEGGSNYRPVPIIDTREYGIISRECVVGIRPFNFRLMHCYFSIFNGKTA